MTLCNMAESLIHSTRRLAKLLDSVHARPHGRRRRSRAFIIAGCLCLLLPSTNVRASVPYSVSFTGISDRALRESLENASQAVALGNRPPASKAQLRRRVQQDETRLQNELRSHGYYNGTVQFEIRMDDGIAHVSFQLDPGPVYRVGEVRILWTNEGKDQGGLPVLTTELEAGQRGTTGSILDEERRLRNRLETRGFPFATVDSRQVLVDHDRERVDVTWHLTPGPRMVFGPLQINGLDRVQPQGVRRRIPWTTGEPYSVELVRELESDLLRWGVFSSVRISLEPVAGRTDEVAASLNLTERKHRTFRLGARYRSDTGVGGLVGWENRNLFRRGDSIEFKVEGSKVEYGADAVYRGHHFLSRRQTLLLESRAAREDTDAYESTSGSGRVLVERRQHRTLSMHAGVGYKYSDVEQLDESEIYHLVYLPAMVDWNTSDDILDPSHGVRLILEVAPYHDVADNNVDWFYSLADFRAYHRVMRSPRMVLAGRFTLGALSGDQSDRIPADERLYAGGGGSVRGYEYQSIGPLAEDNTPLGGSSLAEFSLECRAHVRPPLGAVLFVDGGYVGESTSLDTDEDVQWGAGLGIRYGTPVGPVRVDVAFPLNRRSGVDDSLQFYISIGQAF